MDSAGYFRVLRRYLLFVVAGLLVGLIAAGATAAALPRAYTAQSSLFLQVSLTGSTLKSRAAFAIERVQSYPVLLESPVLLQRVIEDLSLPMTTQQLAENVKADSPPGTSIVTVTATAATPQLAAQIANDAARQLIAKVTTLESAQVTKSNRLQLLQSVLAQRPTAPSTPNVPVLLGLGALAGLVGGYLLGLLLATVRPGVRTREEVRTVTGLPVVAQLSARTAGRRSRLRVSEEAVTFADNVRAIASGTLPPVLLLVPADRRAASSAARYLLARGMSARGAATLVVEADAKVRPPQHVTIPAGAPGISELLADDTADVILRDAVDGIDVVPSGDVSVAPETDAVEAPARRAVTRLTASHDAVIVQATPASAPLPAPALGAVSPGALLLVSRRSTQRAMREVLVRLRLAGIEPLGVVLLDTSSLRPIDLQETWRPDDRVALTPAPDTSSLGDGELEELVGATADSRDD